MPWNQNQDNDKNPWGKKPSGGGSNQTPPDLDELMKRLQERFGGLFGGSGGGNKGGPNLSGGAFVAIFAVAFLLWGASGIYTVAADEEAVVLQFGKHVATKGPGLRWHLPYPIEDVIKIPVTRVQRLAIGVRDMGDGRRRQRAHESLMLTQDENIIDISFVVQYKIKSIDDYIFDIDAPEKTVRDAAEATIREVIGRTKIDDVLTTKKAEVEVETQVLIQSILDGYGAGISITSVNLQDVKPPAAVEHEFKDVQAAKEDREREKNVAETYANGIIPNARGEAKKMVLDAEAYGKEIVDRAQGESDRFTSVLNAYRLAPEVTRKRMYLKTMEEVLAKADKVIIDSKIAGSVLPYLPLDRVSSKVEVKK
ncbi:MAG: FtsH protease activity modulator HflK [Mariprofundaceae bacterium]|nr:FtsH protease activity modulator HflK [Mariprofundaceae bacterium]